MDFTHYSLFESGRTMADFAPLPAGGLPALLQQLHSRCGVGSNMCAAITRGTLHPDGNQISFGISLAGREKFLLILMTLTACREHAAELAAEGNTESAALAAAAGWPS